MALCMSWLYTVSDAAYQDTSLQLTLSRGLGCCSNRYGDLQQDYAMIIREAWGLAAVVLDGALGVLPHSNCC